MTANIVEGIEAPAGIIAKAVTTANPELLLVSI